MSDLLVNVAKYNKFRYERWPECWVSDWSLDVLFPVNCLKFPYQIDSTDRNLFWRRTDVNNRCDTSSRFRIVAKVGFLAQNMIFLPTVIPRRKLFWWVGFLLNQLLVKLRLANLKYHNQTSANWRFLSSYREAFVLRSLRSSQLSSRAMRALHDLTWIRSSAKPACQSQRICLEICDNP